MEMLALSLSGISVLYLAIFLAHHFWNEWREMQQEKAQKND